MRCEYLLELLSIVISIAYCFWGHTECEFDIILLEIERPSPTSE